MRKINSVLIKKIFFLFLLMQGSRICAQSATEKKVTVAVIAPVYLDSLFTKEAYKLGKNNLPRYVLPGLDFYNGVMLAADSLNNEKQSIELLFFDSKNAELSLNKLVATASFRDVSLIIASFTNRNELTAVADFAAANAIPLISATYPNDGGLTGNPQFALLNPTLPVHVEGIYKYLHRYFPTDNIILFRKRGSTEDLIQSILAAQNKKTAGLPLKLKSVELPDSFTAKQVTDFLDSSKQNILICGSLNEQFGLSLSRILSSAKNYPTITVGMPTWDGLR
ncbi:MAG: hypothetical protein RLZZ28_2263, partial [Bacteroidota bacterium]